MRLLLLSGIAAALFAGCSTDLDINAEYKDITVVYGLLNQRDSVHLVKINKAFLGEGNAFDMALVADSNEYQDEAITYAKVFRLDGSGNGIDSFPLMDTIVNNREPGDFYSPTQKLFYFRTPFVQQLNTGRMFLAQDARYQLRMVINGNTITGSTPITNDFTIDALDQSVSGTTSRINLMNATGSDYGAFEYNWTSRQDCKRFVVSYRFRYDEIRGTDTIPKSFTVQIGTRVSASSSASQDLSVEFSGASFYASISSFVRSDPSWQSVDRRIFQGIDFLTSVANDDFHTYLTLTEPVSGIVEDRPVYSNITGAEGVWGSRFGKDVIGKRLNGASLDELIGGGYTFDLRFCGSLVPDGPLLCD